MESVRLIVRQRLGTAPHSDSRRPGRVHGSFYVARGPLRFHWDRPVCIIYRPLGKSEMNAPLQMMEGNHGADRIGEGCGRDGRWLVDGGE